MQDVHSPNVSGPHPCQASGQASGPISSPISSPISRLVLGTVQLGLPYGVANTHGQPDSSQALEIVRAAFAGGITCFDTAQAYGNSEEVLGGCLAALGRLSGESAARVISKPAPEFSGRPGELTGALGLALARIGVPKLEAFLLHREEQLPLLAGEVLEEGRELLRRGLLKGFGVSVYTPEIALRALEHPLVSALQVPASVLDRRFELAGVFERAGSLNKRLYIRSALLQGLLCMEPGQVPEHLGRVRQALEGYRKLCLEYGCKPEGLALAWLLEHYPQAYVLFGAETPEQVCENLASLPGEPLPVQVLERIGQLFPEQDNAILNPALWQR